MLCSKIIKSLWTVYKPIFVITNASRVSKCDFDSMLI